MAKTIRNQFQKHLTYEKLYEAHKLCKRGKGSRDELVRFSIKQEEYIWWLLNQLKEGMYQHGGYTTFYIKEPKLRKVEKAR